MNISVIIPLYNGQEFIERAVLSVFKQTKLPMELIIVDDASTDDSVKIVEAMVPTAPIPIKIIKLEKNSGGPAKPLNTGVREARGELISVLDQDDYFVPQKLAKLHDLLVENPDARLAFSSFFSNSPWPENHPQVVRFKEKAHSSDIRGDVLKMSSAVALSYLLRFSNYVWSFSAFIFYRDDWVAKGGFDEEFVVCTDYDFLCWVATRSGYIYHKERLYFKGHCAGNLSRRAVTVSSERAKILFRYLRRSECGQRDPVYRKKILNEALTYSFSLRIKGDFWTAIKVHFFAMSLAGADAKLIFISFKYFVLLILNQFLQGIFLPIRKGDLRICKKRDSF